VRIPCRRRRRILTQVQLKTDHHAKINHGTALRIVNRIFFAPAGASPQHNPGLFVDATAAKGLNFRYLSSHTSKKYLVETMGAGVALFDRDNDGRLDIFLVSGAPMACLIWLSCPISNGTSTTCGAQAQGRLPDLLPSGYFKPIAPLVYYHEGNGHFTEVSQKIGLAMPGRGLGIACRRLHRMDETRKALRRYQAQQDSAGTAPTSPPTDPPVDPQ
jgi:hypothetical protein